MQTTTIAKPIVKPAEPAVKTVKPVKAFAMTSATDQAIIKNAVSKLALGKTNSAKPGTTVGAANPPKALFALIAGTVRAISNKQIKGAIAYHVSSGNLEKTDTGVRLTAQGAAKFQVDRVAHSPELFQTIAAWMHRNGNTPPDVTRWDGQHRAIEIAAGVKFPNYIHWGSFASKEMRLAFAAIWAK